jgi:D-3-phosphoglycerate dehydrogenase
MNRKRLKVALVDLDGQTVPDWVPESLHREGIDLIVHGCTTRVDLAKHAADADVVWLFGGSRILQESNLDAVPRCRAILRTGSGTDNVPVDEATRRGIVVANTPAAFSQGVSDHLIALLFAVVRQVAFLDRSVRAGRWVQSRTLPFHSVQGRMLGLVGFGHIAQMVARKLSGFEMDVIVYDPYVSAEALAAHAVRLVELDQLLVQADFVSLHCPLTPETRHLIGERELRLMKPTAILLNTSRGPVVDEAALVQALREHRIAAAGLDVLESEPPPPDNPLFSLDNVVLTPHVAGYSADGLALRWRYSVKTILAIARNEPPPSCVNRPAVKPP